MSAAQMSLLKKRDGLLNPVGTSLFNTYVMSRCCTGEWYARKKLGIVDNLSSVQGDSGSLLLPIPQGHSVCQGWRLRVRLP